MTASIKLKSAFYNVTTGLAWMLTSLPTCKPATDVKFDALMTGRRPHFSPACLNQPNPTSVYTLTFLDP